MRSAGRSKSGLSRSLRFRTLQSLSRNFRSFIRGEHSPRRSTHFSGTGDESISILVRSIVTGRISRQSNNALRTLFMICRGLSFESPFLVPVEKSPGVRRIAATKRDRDAGTRFFCYNDIFCMYRDGSGSRKLVFRRRRLSRRARRTLGSFIFSVNVRSKYSNLRSRFLEERERERESLVQLIESELSLAADVITLRFGSHANGI